MAIEITSWIILATVFLIYVIFLIFDAFKREEPYGNLAYVIAVAPTSYFWYLITKPENRAEYESFGAIGIWFLLICLWFIAMIRDMILVKKKKKDMDDVGLYLVIGVVVQLIVSSVLPAVNVLPDMQYWSHQTWIFWLPTIDPVPTGAELILLLFKTMTTLLVLFVIIPMIMDLRGESINMWVLIIITAIFLVPLALVCWLWLPEGWAALLFLVGVLFFILLLLLTRGANQTKKNQLKKK